MKPRNNLFTLSLLALGLSLSSAPLMAESAAPGKEPTVIVDAIELPVATVVAIDPKTREITLKDNETGETTTFVAGKQVRNFKQIKVGDVIRVRMMQALLMEVRAKRELVTRTEVEQGVAVAPKGGQPGMATGRRISTTVTIQALDKDKDYVKFTLPNGEVRSTTAKTAAGKELLHTLKVGDQVDVVFTDAVGISVVPQNKAQ